MRLYSATCTLLCLFVINLTWLPATSDAQDNPEPALPDSWSEQIRWRSIGPANMMGRITSIAVYPGDKNIWWAASASGGLLKTTNNGIKFEHQFDDQATVSIGDVQVSATDPNLLWVGTGEANPRNSVSWGDGVYKSTDGGETWKNMGLKKTFQTGRIAIHPEDHNIVYVGSLGRLWGPNEDRGLFKTTDGGEKWEKVFYVDDKTGVIDVKMNPQNPDEILIATYERMRDGFDSNDPMKKYGAGSGIYKSVDAGKTFTRLTNGLPSCNLGRIGLSYFDGDPNHIAAIVESEKIATEPKTAAYAGLRGEDAEVGAKITQVTEDGPSAKAGLKENDIVVSVDGVVLYSYADMLKEIRKHKSGETVKLVVSRDRKPVDIAVELGKRPEPRRNSRRRGNRRNPFTGTLGGQAANMQGQQGDNEEEYGGIYLSKDGGDSWERINTLNPRPMYYSQIRVDPVDMNNMYVLGTSLYRSKDGGKTFTGDGGGRSVHVDHHALWIDPDDPRHMILGNDGGIYVTYDRMDNWDHHNHAAIGQFYHVGVGSRLDYRVYGGLQDNGSWGGPVRADNDTGTINSDWFRVGGGDGFITVADPDEPDLIYFESQNGGMGRINLETGDRGFIRPRAPRGTRYRFNWKTPFLLSPHNSKIHYSAGNHVFRSYDKGNGIKSISPDITNTDKGAASALTESPVQAGVLYVGTTDGAVWMTKDGGNQWEAVFSRKEEKKEEDKDDEKKADEEGKSTSESETANAEPAKLTEPKINGTWSGKMLSDRFPEGQEPTVTLTLKANDKGEVSGEVETRRGPQEITSGKFDKKTGELTIVIETQRGRREFSAEVKGGTMTGEMSARNGQFQIEFEATKQEDPDNDKNLLLSFAAGSNWLATAIVSAHPQQDEDPISGEWSGLVRNEQLPNGEIEFTLTLKMDQAKSLSGNVTSPQGEFDIDEGQFTPKSGKIYFSGENDQVFLDFEAVLKGGTMKGDVTINDQMTAEFEATISKLAEKKPAMTKNEAGADGERQKDGEDTDSGDANQPSVVQSQATDERGFLGVLLDELSVTNVVPQSAADKAGILTGDTFQSINDRPVNDLRELFSMLQAKKVGDKLSIVVKRDGEKKTVEAVLGKRPAEANQSPRRGSGRGTAERPPRDDENAEADNSEERGTPDDPVSGTWEGVLNSPQGDSDLTLVLKRMGDKITGSYETSRSEGEIVEGKFDSETNALTLVAENERFNLEFEGKVSGENFAGEIDFNGGMFSIDFNVKKTGSVVAENISDTDEVETAVAGSPLEALVPEPLWVSSLHASKYKAERCYISLDGHRSNNDLPHIFVSENFGKTWTSIRGNLPDNAGAVRVIREDRANENILYLGCEFGAWASIDRGETWTKFKNLPTVAVHEIAQHPKLDDIVAATHGRSLWVADVSTLRQLDAESVSAAFKLYKPRPVIAWRSRASRGSSGTRKFQAPNAPVECRIEYSLAKNERSLEIEIRNLNGELMKRFDEPPKSKGFHSVAWDLRRPNSRGRFAGRAQTGDYLVTMRVGSEQASTVVTVAADPNRPVREDITADEFTWWMQLGGLTDKDD